MGNYTGPSVWPGINPGRLRHRVTFQRLTDDVDTVGASAGQWDDLATVAASVEPIGGQERRTADVIAAPRTFTVLARWHHKLKHLSPKDRMRWADRLDEKGHARLFDISDVSNVDERNVLLVITAVERL